MPKIARKPLKLGERHGIVPPFQLAKRSNPVDTLISEFCLPEL
jgi:hypothetical protein